MLLKKRVLPEEQASAEFVSKRVKQSSGRKKPGTGSLAAHQSSGPLVSGSVWRPNASINNLGQEKKREVDLEIKEKIKKKRRRVRAKLTFKFASLILACLASFLLVGMASKRVHISLDNGGGTSYEKELSESLRSDVDGGILGYIRPAFLRYRAIEGSIERQRDEVDNVELHFNLFRMRTEVKVRTNTPLVKWLAADGKPSYVNQKGQVFEPPTSFVALFNPLEIGGSGLGSEPGSKVLASSEKLSWAVGVIPVLREQGIEPIRVNIDAQSFKNVEILLKGVDTRVIFSIDEDTARSGIAAARAIKFIQKGGVEAFKGVGYIDVRTPERVVYK